MTDKTEAAQKKENKLPEDGGLYAIKLGGRKGTEARIVQVMMPSKQEVIDGINGKGPLADYAYELALKGYIAVNRNDLAIPEGQTEQRYPTAATLEQFVANQEAKLEAAGNRGEALRRRRESVDAFIAYLASEGVVQKTLDGLRAIVGNRDSLAARTDVHANLAKRIEAWGATFTEEDMAKHESFIKFLDEAMNTETDALEF